MLGYSYSCIFNCLFLAQLNNLQLYTIKSETIQLSLVFLFLLYKTDPLCVLKGSHQQPNKVMDSSSLSQRCVVSLTQSQVAEQAYDCFDQRPARWRLQQLHYYLYAIAETNSILGHLTLNMAASQMSQGTHLFTEDKDNDLNN